MSFLGTRRASVTVSSAGEQPGPSILLNPEEGSADFSRLSPCKSRSTVRTYSSNASTSSFALTTPSTATSPRGAPNVAGSETGSCSKVSFAPLPERPPELKRRSSITLGVAARKNLLSAGAGRPIGPRAPQRGGSTVVMTDEEWAEYKRAHFPR